MRLEDALEYAMKIGPAARIIEHAEGEHDAELRSAIRDALQPFVGENGVWLGAAAFVVTARRP